MTIDEAASGKVPNRACQSSRIGGDIGALNIFESGINLKQNSS